MVWEGQKALLTRDVLKAISDHLSSREDCKGIEYIIRIVLYNDEWDYLEMGPPIRVFPDTHHRKESDKNIISYHVVTNHFCIKYANKNGTLLVEKDALVKGTYQYKKYTLTNRRRWELIERNEC